VGTKNGRFVARTSRGEEAEKAKGRGQVLSTFFQKIQDSAHIESWKGGESSEKKDPNLLVTKGGKERKRTGR